MTTEKRATTMFIRPTPRPYFDDSVWKPHLAAFAPLPEVFVAHIFRHHHELKPSPVVSLEPPHIFDRIWLHIQRAREIVSHKVIAVVAAEQRTGKEKIVPDWFLKNFRIYSGKDTIPRHSTAQVWSERNLLRSVKHASLEPNSVAALYMMRYLFKSSYRFWLPLRQEVDVPWFYVYGITPEEAVPRIYPYPLSPDLPANMLLWTQWLGASWSPGWVSVPGIGSLAWGKTTMVGGDWFWDLTEDDMASWDQSFVRITSVKRRLELLKPVYRDLPEQGLPYPEQRYIASRTHEIANLLLQHVGEPILAGHMLHYFGSDKVPTKPYIPF